MINSTKALVSISFLKTKVTDFIYIDKRGGNKADLLYLHGWEFVHLSKCFWCVCVREWVRASVCVHHILNVGQVGYCLENANVFHLHFVFIYSNRKNFSVKLETSLAYSHTYWNQEYRVTPKQKACQAHFEQHEKAVCLLVLRYRQRFILSASTLSLTDIVCWHDMSECQIYTANRGIRSAAWTAV